MLGAFTIIKDVLMIKWKTTANIDEYSEKVTQLGKKTQRICPMILTDCS